MKTRFIRIVKWNKHRSEIANQTKNNNANYLIDPIFNKVNRLFISNLLDYDYFSNHYKLIVVDLSKQIELENLDLKQGINFICKAEEDDGAILFFTIAFLQKKQILNFCKHHIKCKHERS